MQIVDYSYSPHFDVLGYKFDNGACLFFGIGPLPGTDVITYRWVQSSGFLDKDQYKSGKNIANKYSYTLGYKGSLSHYLDLKNRNNTTNL